MVVNGREVEVTGESADIAVKSNIFQQWLAGLSDEFVVRFIEFQSVDTVGIGDKKRVLFIKFRAGVADEQGRFIPGIVFMRGGAVAMLVLLRCDGEDYAVLTVQPRFPVGYFAFPEIPAGMLDGSGNFSGVAAKEMKEELGLEIDQSDVIDMTQLTYGDKWRGVYPSAGGCDEFLRIFLYRKSVTKEELDAFRGKCTGELHEGEQITLKIVRLCDLVREAPDAKALSAMALYLNIGPAEGQLA